MPARESTTWLPRRSTTAAARLGLLANVSRSQRLAGGSLAWWLAARGARASEEAQSQHRLHACCSRRRAVSSSLTRVLGKTTLHQTLLLKRRAQVARRCCPDAASLSGRTTVWIVIFMCRNLMCKKSS
jgi:hypothetical protein